MVAVVASGKAGNDGNDDEAGTAHGALKPAKAREDGSEIVIHAMRMRAKYEPFLLGEGDNDA